MCNYCANKKGAHSFSDKKLCPAWGALKGKQQRHSDPKQSKSTSRPFVLRVEEDGEDHYYEVLDKICVLNQNCSQEKAVEEKNSR